MPHSKLKLGIVKVLYAEALIGPYRVVDQEGGKKVIELTLRYTGRKEPLISELVLGSRPGRRHYVGYQAIKPVRSGLGLAILSTPKGILTDKQAREEKVGGELLFRIW